jgi:hypothetical protein
LSAIYYSGASDFSQEGKYIWCTTKRAYNASNLRFGSGQPDNSGGGQHCAVAHVTPGLVTEYDDVGCHVELQYICEVSYYFFEVYSETTKKIFFKTQARDFVYCIF